MVNIPEQAVEAAIRGYASSKQHTFDGQIHDALTAAAPHMSGVKVKQLEWEQHHDVWRCDKHPEYEITRWWLDEEPKQLGHFEIEDALGADQFGTLEEAQAAAQADYEKRILSALEPFQHSIGWLYDSDDAGTEFSENHPIESGECSDAKDIKPATAENLRSELLISWKTWAEDREELNRLRDAPSSAREQALEEAANVVNSDIIKELEDAIAWRKLPGKENHKATLGILERALSAILAFNANLPPRASLDLSNILRHAFISGFEAKGGTITDAINDWPDYNPEKCSAYERIIRALKSQSVPQTGDGK